MLTRKEDLIFPKNIIHLIGGYLLFMKKTFEKV